MAFIKAVANSSSNPWPKRFNWCQYTKIWLRSCIFLLNLLFNQVDCFSFSYLLLFIFVKNTNIRSTLFNEMVMINTVAQAGIYYTSVAGHQVQKPEFILRPKQTPDSGNTLSL